MNSSLPCDVFDPEQFEKIDSALQNLSSSLSSIEYTKERDTTVADKLRKNCEMIENFFDSIFGKDNRDSIFGAERNIMNLSGALASFLCYIDEEICEMTESGEQIKAKLAARLSSI